MIKYDQEEKMRLLKIEAEETAKKVDAQRKRAIIQARLLERK